jgi:hypothetical protein
MDYNIKTKFGSRCRVYENPNCGYAPSVTSITECLHKFALVQWAADCAVDYIDSKRNIFAGFDNEACNFVFSKPLWDVECINARTAYKTISDEAKDDGTNVHSLCELYFRSYHDIAAAVELDNALCSATETTVRMLDNLKKWAVEGELEPVEIEKVLHGTNYSGRADLIARRKGRLGVWDIKRAKAYYPEMGLQLAAYAQAYYYMEQDWPQELGIIRLDPNTGSCNCSEDGRGPHFTDHIDRLTKAFNALCEFYWCANDLQTQFQEIQNEEHLHPSDRTAGQRGTPAQLAG